MVGLLQVLCQGFTDRGVKFCAVYWKPETSINATTQEQFAANILHCTRQLHYSPSPVWKGKKHIFCHLIKGVTAQDELEEKEILSTKMDMIQHIFGRMFFAKSVCLKS